MKTEQPELCTSNCIMSCIFYEIEYYYEEVPVSVHSTSYKVQAFTPLMSTTLGVPYSFDPPYTNSVIRQALCSYTLIAKLTIVGYQNEREGHRKMQALHDYLS